MAGPFPRIPSPPALAGKRRPDAGASPVTIERGDASGPTPSVPRERAVPSAEQTLAPERVPSSERRAPQRPAAGPSGGERDTPGPRQGPPPGMSDAEVNALYAKYVQAKQTLGEDAGPGAYGKLLKTIHAQAPKIMEQYNAKGVDFSVVVKDNQVIIRAKPKP
jgi:hypothetical protein